MTTTPTHTLRARLRRLARDDRGAVSVELVMATPVLILLLLTVIQFGLYLHACHVAQSAAAQGLSAARVSGGTAESGSTETRRALDLLGGGVLGGTTITSTRTAADVSVAITGTAVQVVPFLALTVHAEAHGPVEVFRGGG
ncbi:TadE/TadG family type IV pilus assembly protein [Actinokineospora inagensis]|uniref:TadE/TadG family type IV pilus assembly protein n=1 Tax=Actinokineospora inagensis TaxID=103730 RepID=UPI000478ACC9|nr:TadE/TadG family type IV pilus assembly protein [Actinokineospora inagensis]